MTTNYIDLAFHGSAFPAAYVVPGVLQALGVTTTTNMLIGNPVLDNDSDVISGYFTGAGNAVVIPIGFAPTKITVTDWTNTVLWEWKYGAPATKTMKNGVLDTNSQIVVTQDMTSGIGNVCSVTLGATLAANSAVLSFRVEA